MPKAFTVISVIYSEHVENRLRMESSSEAAQELDLHSDLKTKKMESSIAHENCTFAYKTVQLSMHENCITILIK